MKVQSLGLKHSSARISWDMLTAYPCKCSVLFQTAVNSVGHRLHLAAAWCAFLFAFDTVLFAASGGHAVARSRIGMLRSPLCTGRRHSGDQFSLAQVKRNVARSQQCRQIRPSQKRPLLLTNRHMAALASLVLFTHTPGCGCKSSCPEGEPSIANSQSYTATSMSYFLRTEPLHARYHRRM